MTHRSIWRRLCDAAGLVAATVVLAVSPAGPADAATTRGCNATAIFAPVQSGLSAVQYSFSAQYTVPYRVWANNAREWARYYILRCTREHWAARTDPDPPAVCTTSYPESGPYFHGYPFRSMDAEVSEALCAANPEQPAFDVNFIVTISGNTGCGGDNNHWRVEIDNNHPIRCPGRIGEGSLFENVEEEPTRRRAPPPPPPSPAPAPGSAGAPPPPPSPPPSSGAGASFQVLNNIRLPGNDLGTIDVPDGNWQACQHACSVNDACRAWTYRDRFRGVQSVCLLKHDAGPQIPDTCCRSGIRR